MGDKQTRKKIYFASDFHLGVKGRISSEQREKQIVSWLEDIRKDAMEIYLLGDLFDFWFEYKTVIPKGYVRLLGKLAELRDQGIPIYFFTGNHDMWMFSYLEEELNIPIIRKPIQKEILGKNFFIGHGDGLGPGDTGYKIIKRIFANPVCQWLFARIHPNSGIGLANFWSGLSRESHDEIPAYLGPEKEWLISYCNRKTSALEVDYFVFGHRHLPINHLLKNNLSRYINIGDWLYHNSYAVFDGERLEILFYDVDDHTVVG